MVILITNKVTVVVLIALLVTFFAREANFKVLLDSSKFDHADLSKHIFFEALPGLTVQRIEILAFPLNEGSNTRVSLLSL